MMRSDFLLQKRRVGTIVTLFFLGLALRSSQAWVPPPTTTTKTNLSKRTSTRRGISSLQAGGGGSSRSISGCSVEFTDPETDCHVVLVGCFHGSQSSAQDVHHAISASPTQVVVLELCANRFADLRRDFVAVGGVETKQSSFQVQRNTPSSTLNSDDDDEASSSSVVLQQQQQHNRQKTPWMMRFATMVRKTSERKGWSTAAAAAVLGGVSGLQTALSGLQPGLEFTTALELAAGQDKDIVLADQDVDEILSRLGRLPETSLELWRDLVLESRNWEDSAFCEQSIVLQTALFGSPTITSASSSGSSPNCVTLPGFLTRNVAAVQELLRLAVPPFLLLQGLNWVAKQWATTSAAAVVESSSSLDATTTVVAVVANAAFMGFTYLTIALPATRIILSERDDRLAQGVRAACQLAAAQADGSSSKKGRVVAVLGFLHVNGVAEKVLRGSDDGERVAT